MSILIKGLIMPSCCDGCTFSDWSNLHQTASCKLHDYDPCFSDYSREYTDKRADFCPLVEIPEPHGELIDRDALLRNTILCVTHPPYITRPDVVDAPAIIAREDGENHEQNI